LVLARRRAGRATLLLSVVFIGMLLPHGMFNGFNAVLTTTSGGTSVAWPNSYTIVQHQLPDPGSEPWEITAGPSGQIWFAEQGTNMLGEYSEVNGTFHQYPIPSARPTPDGVAVDKSGNVWISELTSSRLGELAEGGDKIVEYAIPNATAVLGTSIQPVSCGPGALLPDQDGDIWIACLFSNQIDRFDPSTGTFDVYNLPVFQSAPAGMAFDSQGDIWFTAADAQMLGKAVVSELSNDTTDGITEFAPLNQTYPMEFAHATSFLGTTETITSSLPTPSGIVVSPTGRIWVTEHVDSSFDSYDPTTRSIVRYWTSQTYDVYNYTVSFPNGIVMSPNGTVWIGEHYGNKILEFDPSSDVMTEYPVHCCTADVAGVYSIALDQGGNLWFVEINGDAIGEVVPAADTLGLGLGLPGTAVTVGSHGSVSLPLTFSESSGASSPTTLKLSVSGVSGTGEVQNMTSDFSLTSVSVAPGKQASTTLALNTDGIRPGVYYLTLGAATPNGGPVYSVVLKLTVEAGPSLNLSLVVPAVVVVTAAGAIGGWVMARRSRRKGSRRQGRRRSFAVESLYGF
jgi:streptogramin lyase